ncbi:hypothetical protein MNBD_IGNAVI01-2489 [hydrothermal vent metagenome]|uniref:HNH nuclease domain-containing protein n=1 Tax=hydrothermal vent metagenome TaxID=652676 RepID=A0A3B1D3R0_9ZZZZ
MLRLYKPIQHDIFKLQSMLEHLVCNVWCEANSGESCESKLDADFKVIYDSYDWLKKEIDVIYTKFIPLSDADKKSIKDAFSTNNKIEKLCEGTETPIYLDELPDIVENKIKPLFVDFYEKLLERAKVPGTKKDYYEKLIEENDFHYCPCCGLIDFESSDSKYREAFDHYLPKSDYPFSSVNFHNLVPLCYKCNSDRKKVKDPIKDGRKAFYPFIVNGQAEHRIGIKITIDKSKDLRNLDKADLTIEFEGYDEKIETWDSLFDIKERYNDSIRKKISKTLLQRIKRRHQLFRKNNASWTYDNTLNFLIDDYENDLYEDKKFLKKPFMIELKSSASLIEVYG